MSERLDWQQLLDEALTVEVAYLCMNEVGQLDEETARASRGYIQHWLDSESPPDKAIQQVFTAADRILRAGKMPVSAAPNSAPNFGDNLSPC